MLITRFCVECGAEFQTKPKNRRRLCYNCLCEHNAEYMPTPAEIAAECLKIRLENALLPDENPIWEPRVFPTPKFGRANL